MKKAIPRPKGKAGFNRGRGWDERSRLTAAAGACGILLIVALLVPLAFRASPEARGSGALSDADSVKPSAEARAALFAAFWYGAEAGADGTVEITVTKAEPDAVTTAYCEQRMAALTARCIDDRALAGPAPAGSEYTTVTGTDGTEAHLCRMWLQASGDWQNWLDVCFDTDDGRVYYLYVSQESLTNRHLYTDRTRPDWGAVAALLAENTGGRLRHFSENSAGGTAVIETETGILCYQITGAYYDALVDIRINCV